MTDLPCVLMVDDNAADCELIRIACAEACLGIGLLTAADGIHGREILERMRDGVIPSCRAVLLDLNMPRLDGRSLLAWIKAQDRLRHLPVIIFSSSPAHHGQAGSPDGGASAYWVKPARFVDFLAIAQALRPYLEDQPPSAASAGAPA